MSLTLGLKLNQQGRIYNSGQDTVNLGPGAQASPDRNVNEAWWPLHREGGHTPYTPSYPMPHNNMGNLYDPSTTHSTQSVNQHQNYQNLLAARHPYPASSSHAQGLVSGVNGWTHTSDMHAFGTNFNHQFQFQVPFMLGHGMQVHPSNRPFSKSEKNDYNYHYPTPMPSPASEPSEPIVPPMHSPPNFPPEEPKPDVNVVYATPPAISEEDIGPVVGNVNSGSPANLGDSTDSNTDHTSSSPHHSTSKRLSLLRRTVDDGGDVDETWTVIKSGTRDLWPPPSYMLWLNKKPAEWVTAYLNASSNDPPTPQAAAQRDRYSYSGPKDSPTHVPYFLEGEPGMGYTFTNCQLVEVILTDGSTTKVVERILENPMFFCWDCGKGIKEWKGSPKDIIRHLGVHGDPSWSCKTADCECGEDVLFKRQDACHKHCREVNPNWKRKAPLKKKRIVVDDF